MFLASNVTSEQTFGVTVTTSDPPDGVLPATLEGTSGPDFDYTLGLAGFFSTFEPGISRVSFRFFLNGDNLTESTEAFVATATSSPGFPTFQVGNSVSAYQAAEIRIVDNDGKKMF